MVEIQCIYCLTTNSIQHDSGKYWTDPSTMKSYIRCTCCGTAVELTDRQAETLGRFNKWVIDGWPIQAMF